MDIHYHDNNHRAADLVNTATDTQEGYTQHEVNMLEWPGIPMLL